MAVKLSLVALLCGACGSDGDSKSQAGSGDFAIASLGLSVTGFGEFAGSLEYLDDGTGELVGDAQVTIAGKGTHTVLVEEYIEPAAKGARVTLFVTDETAGTERFFHYEPGDNAVVVGDDKGGVFVFQNPDGSYDVVTGLFDGPESEDVEIHAEDGYAAYQIVKDYNQFTTTTPHAMLMAYAMAQHAGPEARTAIPLLISGGNQVVDATPPEVCGVFKAFCDCVACDFSGVGSDCHLCPAR
ncbi:MAG: hypothetical protein R3F39_24860 [Myxococcota bacterium]